ncbi:hypothetical protein [Clostridium butyricum]|uniref:hypothetical protein n=1 Tax=Clostridium butyricum TaxID=1492 RepID=UPI00374E7BD0
MIKENNIQDINNIKNILDNLRKYVTAYEEQLGELSESKNEDITFQLAEIDSFLIGPQKYTKDNLANADIRLMSYWEYIYKKCDFNQLMESLKKYEGEI